MRVLIFWDIYWRVWRKAFIKNFEKFKNKYSPDFIIANVENMSSGRWPIEKHILELDKLDIDVYTSWNHILDNYVKIKDYISKDNSKLIRPANFYETPEYNLAWKWYKIIEKNGKKLLVINIMSSLFLRDDVYNPFLKVNELLQDLWNDFSGIIIDFHRETTREIYAMWMMLDSKISMLYGTHTHIQTNDDIILPWWTWLLSDIWMCWPLYSVIWADFESIKMRYLTWIHSWKIEQSLDNNYVISWLIVDIDEKTKKTTNIEKFRYIDKL